MVDKNMLYSVRNPNHNISHVLGGLLCLIGSLNTMYLGVSLKQKYTKTLVNMRLGKGTQVTD